VESARATHPELASGTHLRPGTLVGDWRIEALIGEGGMGTVYAAIHRVIGKEAALKVVRHERSPSMHTRERLVLEARVVNQIKHPNIVDIFQLGELDDGRSYLVMELLRGRTLGDRLEDGALGMRETIDILLQIVDAVAAAHAAGVVHCDLKPDNIFLCATRDGTRVKVLDWGIARVADGPPQPAYEGIVGTPRHLSPEQARGDVVDHRADIYSLGTIAYHLFLGRPSFLGDDALELVSRQQSEVPPPPRLLRPDVAPVLETLLVGMLSKDPAARPSLIEVTSVLRQLAARAALRVTARAMVALADDGCRQPDRMYAGCAT
jgi:serine/threonine protein kinase